MKIINMVDRPGQQTCKPPGGPVSAQQIWLGLVQPNLKERERERERERLGLLGHLSAQPDPVGPGPTYIIIY